MAEITTEMVKELRTATNAGVLDCRKALTEADGNFEKAVDILRKKGVAKAGTKGAVLVFQCRNASCHFSVLSCCSRACGARAQTRSG